MDGIWTRDFISNIIKMYNIYKYSESWRHQAAFDMNAFNLKWNDFIENEMYFHHFLILMSGKEKEIVGISGKIMCVLWRYRHGFRK